MKKKCISILAAVVFTISMAVTLCSCDKRVDGNSITVGEMTIELPDGEWRIDNDSEYDNEVIIYDKDIGTINLCETDGNEYMMNFHDRLYFDNEPNATTAYINGYRTEFDINQEETYAAVKVSYNDYYFFNFKPNDNFYDAESTGIQLIKSISFGSEAPSNYDRDDNEYIITWKNANYMVKDMIADGGSETSEEYYVKGKVKKVTTSNGNTFIDIGKAYPDKGRVTGVIWKEYAKNFEYSPYFYEGETVYLRGNIYPYDGCANIKLESDSQIIKLVDIDSLDEDFLNY